MDELRYIPTDEQINSDESLDKLVSSDSKKFTALLYGYKDASLTTPWILFIHIIIECVFLKWLSNEMVYYQNINAGA